MTGRVYKSTGSWYTVKTELGQTYECRIKGKFRLKDIKSTNPIAVGDFVDFELDTKSDQETGVINTIHDRQNYIVRKSVNLSKQTHIIACLVSIQGAKLSEDCRSFQVQFNRAAQSCMGLSGLGSQGSYLCAARVAQSSR